MLYEEETFNPITIIFQTLSFPIPTSSHHHSLLRICAVASQNNGFKTSKKECSDQMGAIDTQRESKLK